MEILQFFNMPNFKHSQNQQEVTHLACRSPEAVGNKDHPPLQEEGGADPDEAAHTQAPEQALEVHVLQSGVQGPAELDGLEGEHMDGG